MSVPIRPIADPSARADAAKILRAGGLVAFATETVYGLGADATDETAVARIFAAKGRPRFNPLISHVPDVETAFALGQATAAARTVAEAFWPGPLTLVLRRTEDCPIAWLTSAGLDTVAIRVPGSADARALLAEAGRPVAAPSANRSGRVSPTIAAHVAAEGFEGLDLILDGGACAVGLESTVLDVSGDRPRLLRPGSVTREQIEALVGSIELAGHGDAITAPGMLASHYAPAAPVRLNATTLRDGEVGLDFAGQLGAATDLSASGDPVEAAANLFALLRALDRPGIAAIAVAPVPEAGLGAAINDRLRRAAAPRG
ncbi:L-threonylcarbamoyladenylate synthase [Thalassobaculum litoreum]|uniref:Threonylcarbamoyl-AMP synthase n=1 Tax=Thalassobaculum litoreum DSM 18839 TaxID=1123362 RepID=A0A8G2EZM7_9PROT|nr:L-threonylcarbamoyladenylate synthase [Thalassobaculum litoreum]SDG31691.1 L-threonylcarbamoyladenylate synthase [Thalassobaculum litoreum DSM 18839]